jgi:hypothetical protein
MSNGERISVIIAGGADLRSALIESFAAAPDIEACEAATPQQALERVEAKAFDFLLACDDLSAPGADALLCEARAAGFNGAAVLLAHEPIGEPDGFCAAFDLPVRFFRLLSWIRARAAAQAAPISGLALGEQIFCEATQTLIGPEGSCALTEKETALLARLARARGGAVPRDLLLREIWGYNSAVSTHTLETHIHRLRRKIEKAAAQPRVLLTAPGGYRLATDLGDDL